LSDRLILQGAYLYGVRFGGETSYALLDIDRGSPYHPAQDALAVSRLVAALEPLGLIDYVACTSSYSGGLHLYFPFTQLQSSWKLAISLAAVLEAAGFKLKPGHLEVFPNPKPYVVDGLPTLFNAHRLPLQVGSYLVNKVFSPVWSTQHHFVQQWLFAQQRNSIDTVTLQRVVKQFRRRHYLISGKADKFINDLNAEIELGWTGFGQTNRLLGRITMREYIFYHVLVGGEPLRGEPLANRVVEVARSLPGYEEFCRHRHEIDQRAEEWVRCIENSHYFHYGDARGKFKPQGQPSAELQKAVEQTPSWNQQQALVARERIRTAIAHLFAENALPSGATARFRVLVRYGIGGSTLYRHRDLWHPKWGSVAGAVPGENPPHPPTTFEPSSVDALMQSTELHASSLFPADGRNPADSQASEGLVDVPVGAVGRNFQPSGDRPRYTRPSNRTWIAKMKQFLDSEDPILIAEALLWAEGNPGVLDSS
jgi:hypothetical protein